MKALSVLVTLIGAGFRFCGLSALITLAHVCVAHAAVNAPKVFGAWRAACNEEACLLINEGDGPIGGALPGLSLRLLRPTGAKTVWAVGFKASGFQPDLLRPFNISFAQGPTTTLRPGGDFAAFATPDQVFVTSPGGADRLFRRMIKERLAEIELIDAAGRPHRAGFKLTGLIKALDWADRRQGRLPKTRRGGAPSGMARVGMPDRRALLETAGIPARVMGLHETISACEPPDGPSLKHAPSVIASLSKTAALYGVPCLRTGRNTLYRLYVAESGEIGGIHPLFFAQFVPKYGWVGTDMLANIRLDPSGPTLESRFEGRRASDCGTRARWQWVDYAFALREFSIRRRCGSKAWRKVYPAP